MQNRKIIYSAIAIITLAVIGIAVYMQNSGELLQGNIKRTLTDSSLPTLTTTDTTTDKYSTTSYTVEIDQTMTKLNEIESKIDNLTSLISNQNQKIDVLTSNLNKLTGKIKIFANEFATMGTLDCQGQDYTSCSTSAARIIFESDLM